MLHLEAAGIGGAEARPEEEMTGRPGNENLTEAVSNLPRRLQSRGPSAVATRPTCAGRVALHTDSSRSLRASIYTNTDSEGSGSALAVAVLQRECGR